VKKNSRSILSGFPLYKQPCARQSFSLEGGVVMIKEKRKIPWETLVTNFKHQFLTSHLEDKVLVEEDKNDMSRMYVNYL
jgi:hypothetical protein